MKRILVSMSTVSGSAHTRIDHLSRKYIDFFEGCLIIPLLNNTNQIVGHLKQTDVVVISNGTEPIDVSNERTVTEQNLIKEALARDIPLLGVGRGFHMINLFFGGASRFGRPERKAEILITQEPISVRKSSGVVISDTRYIITSSEKASALEVFALRQDGVIEGLFHPKKKVIALQWDPFISDSSWVDDGIKKYLKTPDF